MGNELTNEQCAAISRSIKLGEALIKDHSEIADLYRGGMFASTIAEKLDIQLEYGVTEKIAMEGVNRAIAGHNGSFDLDSYVGLIPKEERERLGREHMQEGGREGGRETYEKKLGIHGRTTEQNREGGRKGGRETYEKKLGIHGRTAEQISEDGRKGAIAKGQTPWVTGRIPEIEYAHALTFLPEFQRGSLVNNELIALELNIEYHDCEEVRTTEAVRVNLYKHRKSLENRV